jgi:hypothetical protein
MAQPAPAPMEDANPKVITINADGSITPSTGVVINPGGEVKFEVSYPSGKNTATVQFVLPIQFSYEAGIEDGGSNTIKVG